MSPGNRSAPDGDPFQAVLDRLRRDYWSALQAGEAEPPLDLPEAEMVVVAGDRRVRVPLALCREVVKVPVLARLPRAPVGLLGAAAVRGEVVPVLCLATLLGSRPALPAERSRLVLVRTESGPLALRVDAIERLAGPDPTPDRAEDADLLDLPDLVAKVAA